MAAITVRNLDETLKTRLRVQAARNGHSMEEEVRLILKRALEPRSMATGLGDRIRQRFAAAGGVELNLPPRLDQVVIVDIWK